MGMAMGPAWSGPLLWEAGKGANRYGRTTNPALLRRRKE
jgi:hypothetical protein